VKEELRRMDRLRLSALELLQSIAEIGEREIP
jgi:hypothetical protein